mgnify:CR=1 FL=1
MTNAEKITSALIDWANPMLDDIAAQVIGKNQTMTVATEWIRKYFPVSAEYSLWNDLKFLASPLMQTSISRMMTQGIQSLGLSDEELPEYARGILASLSQEAESKGQLQLLERYTFTADEVRSLCDKVEANLQM